MKYAPTHPMWIIGPSGPTGRPAPTAHEQEKNLTQIAGRFNTWRITVPLRKPITSGIPEPPASWQMNCIKHTQKSSALYRSIHRESKNTWSLFVITLAHIYRFLPCDAHMWYCYSKLFVCLPVTMMRYCAIVIIEVGLVRTRILTLKSSYFGAFNIGVLVQRDHSQISRAIGVRWLFSRKSAISETG